MVIEHRFTGTALVVVVDGREIGSVPMVEVVDAVEFFAVTPVARYVLLATSPASDIARE